MTTSSPNNTKATITLHPELAKPISSDLFGIFFEDLNYAADGGLYAELLQNRSFEYSSADHRDWNFLTGWELIQDGGACSVALASTEPLHPNNPHYLLLHSDGAGTVGLRNSGFGGIALKAGERYRVALSARATAGAVGPLRVRLEGRTGEVLGEATLPAPGPEWANSTAAIACAADDRFARFALLIDGAGTVALDMISLFPERTFCGRPNGLRADLAHVIADLRPRFVRFPGGCLAHGDGLDNMYRWKDTIGSIETRREQPNIWGYHQSVGLGYYEYFLFCEDIGAKPVPVVPAGVCCQNSGAKITGRWGEGQCALPLEAMPDYIQEVLDLIEWANGPITSTWGAKRAEQGHPEPFGLEYLGVGNEDAITPAFRERFALIADAVKAKHPEITVIGTAGPFPDGEDYEAGWALARELKLAMVDEHGYKTPDWYWEQLGRFDAYPRDGITVYLGEYAAHERDRRNTLRSALAEAAYMTSLERNGDLVRLASYAPLLAKQQHTQWLPDLIYFDNTRISPSINYYVQQLFSLNAGDRYLPTTVATEDASELAVSCVHDRASGDLILKLVSRAGRTIRLLIDLAGAGPFEPQARCTTLAGEALAENAFGQPPAVVPETTIIGVGPMLTYKAPPHSLSVIRLLARSEERQLSSRSSDMNL